MIKMQNFIMQRHANHNCMQTTTACKPQLHEQLPLVVVHHINIPSTIKYRFSPFSAHDHNCAMESFRCEPIKSAVEYPSNFIVGTSRSVEIDLAV